MLKQEAFQYPTRLGRMAFVRAAPFYAMKKTARLRAVFALFYLRLLPRLPSMLRFRSAIFPSEEERKRFSLSSKA